MHWQLFLLVLTVLLLMMTITSCVLWLLSKKVKSDSQQITSLQLMVKDLVHLAAARDLSSYATMQQIPNQETMQKVLKSQLKNSSQEQVSNEIKPEEVIDFEIIKEFGMEF